MPLCELLRRPTELKKRNGNDKLRKKEHSFCYLNYAEKETTSNHINQSFHIEIWGT